MLVPTSMPLELEAFGNSGCTLKFGKPRSRRQKTYKGNRQIPANPGNKLTAAPRKHGILHLGVGSGRMSVLDESVLPIPRQRGAGSPVRPIKDYQGSY